MILSGFGKFESYPRKVIAHNFNGIVIALDDARVAKLRHDNSHELLMEESKKMEFANQVNDLVVRFHEVSRDSYNNNLLIMERVYPLEYRALDVETRYEYCEVFEQKMRELHQAGFVFHDLNATILLSGQTNFMLTHQGIRLIDTGNSLLREEIGNTKFDEQVSSEVNIMREIKKIMLNHKIPVWAQT
jgi:tRNA A-37 threonylcarbamoyl transferase component Bud32